jgi:toxin ParE1/3/4
MPKFLVQKAAAVRIRNIYHYTQETWGEKQAKEYIKGLFQTFNDIAEKHVIWRPIPAEFEVNGYYATYKKHTIYWKELKSDLIGIVTVLRKRMHQQDRFQDDNH